MKPQSSPCTAPGNALARAATIASTPAMSATHSNGRPRAGGGGEGGALRAHGPLSFDIGSVLNGAQAWRAKIYNAGHGPPRQRLVVVGKAEQRGGAVAG